MKIEQLIKLIENRPKHFLRTGTLREFESFYRGYAACLFELAPDDNKTFEDFRLWIKKKFKHANYPDWPEYFIEGRKDDEALTFFFQIWREYISELENTKT